MSETEDRVVESIQNKTKKDKELKSWTEHHWAVGQSGSLLYMLLEFWKVMGEELKTILRNYSWKILKNSWTSQTHWSKKFNKPKLNKFGLLKETKQNKTKLCQT